MTLVTFAEAYSQLPTGEQSQFADVVRRLLSDGLVWREDEGATRTYAFLVRRRELVTEYLQVAGWELQHEERLGIFRVAHRDGAHRRRLSRDTTIWLLLLRLVYAEQRERLSVQLTRYPTITVGELSHRLTELLPGQTVRKKTSLDEALRTLQSLKLIRPARGGGLRASDSDALIELLPTLEVVVPAAAITEIAERLASYGQKTAADDEE